MYFGFKKITEIMKHYKTLRENVHTEHNRIYGKALPLSTEIGSEEGMPRVIRGQQTRPNPEVASACDYWRVTITNPFLDSIISEMESRFAEDKGHILNFVHSYLRLSENKMCKQHVTF